MLRACHSLLPLPQAFLLTDELNAFVKCLMQQIKRPLEAGIKRPHLGLFFFNFFARVVLRRADKVRAHSRFRCLALDLTLDCVAAAERYVAVDTTAN